MNMTSERTTSPPLTQVRDAVAGACPSCGDGQLHRYPVNSEGGWWEVVKCQTCLSSVSRTKIGRLGPIQLLSDTIGEAKL